MMLRRCKSLRKYNFINYKRNFINLNKNYVNCRHFTNISKEQIRKELTNLYRVDKEQYDEIELKEAIALPDLYPPPQNLDERKALAPDNTYIDETNILNHHRENWGQIYEVSKDTLQNIPEEFQSCMEDEFDAVNGSLMMIRPEAWSIVQDLEAFRKKEDVDDSLVLELEEMLIQSNYDKSFIETDPDTGERYCVESNLPNISDSGTFIQVRGFQNTTIIEDIKDWMNSITLHIVKENEDDEDLSAKLQQIMERMNIFIVKPNNGVFDVCQTFIALPEITEVLLDHLLSMNGQRVNDKYISITECTSNDIATQIDTTLNDIQRILWYTNKSVAPHSILIDGVHGSGKSATLHYVLQYAYNSNFLVIPTQAPEFAYDRWAYIRRNANDPNIFDQTRMTRVYLHGLLTNPKVSTILKTITLKHNESKEFASLVYTEMKDDSNYGEQLSAEEVQFGWLPDPIYDLDVEQSKQTDTTSTSMTNEINDMNLYDFLYNAIKYGQDPGDTMNHFVAEVNEITEVPVLIIVDSFNCWDGNSTFIDPDDARHNIPCSKLNLVNHFNNWIDNPPKNGIVLLATSTKYKMKWIDQHRKLVDHICDVEPYSISDSVTQLHHYWSSQFLIQEVKENLVGRVMALTNGVPKAMRKLCSLL